MSDLIEKARRFAFEAHNAIGQRRKYTDEPYTVHLEAVAELVESAGGDDEMIAAAYLHDIVEDTETSIEDIESLFGSDVAYLVDHLTDVSSPGDGNRAERKALDRAHTAKGDARVQTIKLADIIHNCQTVADCDPEFAKVYLEEKRKLLEVLQDGDADLLAAARKIVRE